MPCPYRVSIKPPLCRRASDFKFFGAVATVVRKSPARARAMSKAKRKAAEVEEKVVAEKRDEKKEEEELAEEAEEAEADEKKADDAKEEGEGEGDVGEKERLKLIKARRKQLLDDIRDEQNKAVAAAQVRAIRISPPPLRCFRCAARSRWLSAASQERTAKDRLQFLLQQSEIYTHFMKPDAAKKAGKAGGKNAASPARRTGRITEKEEDDLLLQEAKTDAPAIQLTSTPPCTYPPRALACISRRLRLPLRSARIARV